MAKVADIGGKRLISLAPDAWVQWVTQQPDVVAGEILASEFQWISRDTMVIAQILGCCCLICTLTILFP